MKILKELRQLDIKFNAPLIYSGYFNQYEMAELLISKGADIDAKNINDQNIII